MHVIFLFPPRSQVILNHMKKLHCLWILFVAVFTSVGMTRGQGIVRVVIVVVVLTKSVFKYLFLPIFEFFLEILFVVFGGCALF